VVISVTLLDKGHYISVYTYLRGVFNEQCDDACDLDIDVPPEKYKNSLQEATHSSCRLSSSGIPLATIQKCLFHQPILLDTTFRRAFLHGSALHSGQKYDTHSIFICTLTTGTANAEVHACFSFFIVFL